MTTIFVGRFRNDELCGISLSCQQIVDLRGYKSRVAAFDRSSCTLPYQMTSLTFLYGLKRYLAKAEQPKTQNGCSNELTLHDLLY